VFHFHRYRDGVDSWQLPFANAGAQVSSLVSASSVVSH
jgi:hypothetical protein